MSGLFEKICNGAIDHLVGVIVTTMFAAIGAVLLAAWPTVKSLDRLSLSLVLGSLVALATFIGYYALRISEWWKISISSFLKLEFDPAINMAPGVFHTRRASLVIRNSHARRDISGAILKLDFIRAFGEPSFFIESHARQFSHVQIPPEHNAKQGRSGVDLLPGERESFICLLCSPRDNWLYVYGFDSGSGEPSQFKTPLADYRLSFTASAKNATPITREFDLRSVDGSFVLVPAGENGQPVKYT